MSKRPRVPGTLRRPTGTLHFARALPDGASLATRLGATLKTQAEIEPPCVCGSWPSWYAVEKWDAEEPKVRHLPDGPGVGEVAWGVYVHADDCLVLAAAEAEEQAVVASTKGE